MENGSELLNLLKSFALRADSSYVSLSEFCGYLHKYSRRFLQEKPELIVYLEITEDTLLEELKALQTEGKIEITEDKAKKQVIFIPHYFINKVTRRYKEIQEKPEIPFPLTRDTPRNFSTRFLKKISLEKEFAELSENPTGSFFLYELGFSDDTPSLIFPANFTAENMLLFAVDKIRMFLHEDESHDFIQKKLLMANPGKEISVRSFLSKMRARPAAIVDTLKQSGDIYLLWSYLCSFIRQEFAKKTEKLPDEVALIQGVFITEYLNNYYRNKAQQNLQRETALKNLELNLQKQPYYFNMNMITNFKDTRGVPLLGQYSEDDLKTYMENQTTEITSGSLPHLLSFQTFDKDRYYVLLEKVIPLIISLTTENRKIIKEQCMQYWYDQMLKFIQTESMKSDEAFEIFLKEICKEQVPHLYALLNSSFIPPLVIEPKLVDTQSVELNRIFPEGKLALYQDLFALKRAKLLTDTRILLPFWYTLPFFSAIVAFFKRIRKPKKTPQTQKPEEKTTEVKATIKDIAVSLGPEFIPAGLSIDEALIKQLDLWNHNINEETRNTITQDVNAFIRDYIRGIQKTLTNSTFNAERIRNLAQTLADTPSLRSIKNKAALRNYIELYILKLVQLYL